MNRSNVVVRPTVSVLIDTYNYGRYVERAIESAVDQDFPRGEREVLVVDDGSTDDTEDRVRKFGNAIRYFRKPNGGQASAFNLGLRHARGKYIALLDADDFWMPNKLSRVVNEFERHPDAGMVYHGYLELSETDPSFCNSCLPSVSGFLPANTSDLLCYVLYPTSFLSFRRSAIDLLLPVPENLTIQADAHLSGLVIFVAPIVAIPEELAVYRQHSTNLFAGDRTFDRNRRKVRVKTRADLICGMKNWLDERGYDLERSDLKALFKQWALAQEGDEFELANPNRFQIARHLVEYVKYYRPRMGLRHQAVTYLNAAGSLVVGYKNLHKLDEWRTAITHPFRRTEGIL
jgi:glycosyltransferase involved in cell wall biosynthesis